VGLDAYSGRDALNLSTACLEFCNLLGYRFLGEIFAGVSGV
jgi:hypothetical protein